MTREDKIAVIDMMRVFYASDAVMTNGSEEIFQNATEACVSDSPYAEGYVFQDGTEICGYAMIAKSFSTEFGKPCIWIEDIYVKPPYRSQGIGRRFLDTLFDTYKSRVVYRLEAETDNRVAVALYRKCGFDVLPYLEMIKNTTDDT